MLRQFNYEKTVLLDCAALELRHTAPVDKCLYVCRFIEADELAMSKNRNGTVCDGRQIRMSIYVVKEGVSFIQDRWDLVSSIPHHFIRVPVSSIFKIVQLKNMAKTTLYINQIQYTVSHT